MSAHKYFRHNFIKLKEIIKKTNSNVIGMYHVFLKCALLCVYIINVYYFSLNYYFYIIIMISKNVQEISK